jgi:hypothetical protein
MLVYRASIVDPRGWSDACVRACERVEMPGRFPYASAFIEQALTEPRTRADGS